MGKSLALKIKRLRELRNFKQEFLAKKLQISVSAYSNIENGKTKLTIDRIQKIASIFGVNYILLLTSPLEDIESILNSRL